VNKTVRIEQPPRVPGQSQPPIAPQPPQQPFGRFTVPSIARPAAVHPLAEPMYWACADLLTLASQLALGATPPSAPELRQHLSQLFATMHGRALSNGIAPEDANDAIYAIMALFDEILVQARWSGRLEWQTSPLQYVHFHENIAGENFFRRADVLLGQPHRTHVLLVYFLCLGLGFQGRYAVGGGAGLGAVYETIGAAVSRSLPPAEVISPHGEPADAVRSLLRREKPIVRVALGFFLLALLAFVGLRLTLSSQMASTVQPMRDYAASKP
jgi:type VI secretion system protein ImpK